MTLSRRRRSLLAAGVGVLLLASCGASSRGHVTLAVETGGRIDSPVRITLSGLQPRARITLAATATDASGGRWSSSAVFVATSRGVVTPVWQAPVAGSYRGVDGQGLIWSMRSRTAPFSPFFVVPRGGEHLTIAASTNGKPLAARTVVHRIFGRRVATRELRPRASAGLYGSYFAPAANRRRTAVLVLGGSEGGAARLPAALLAAHGFPALALAYFKEPGLPGALRHIPLEYVARAIRWLGRQPGVDASHVVLYGASRGTEAALLVASYFPKLVSAVVALSPSNVALGAFPGCAGAAWTLGGREVPYQCRSGPTADPHASAIPIERFRSPLFLACGGDDLVWPSCPMARALLRRHHDDRDTLRAYPDAGHGVDSPLPGIPGYDDELAGGTAQANPEAREQLWPSLLAFIASR